MSVQWSIRVQPVGESEPWQREGEHDVLRTASIGKVLLLGEVARQLASGELDGSQRLRREDALFVADSGLWHHLDQSELSVLDACRLVGATSDNLATNALIGLVGLEAIATFAQRHALAPLAQHDFVRDPRDPSLPGVAPVLSEADAAALVRYFSALHDGEIDARVGQWLGLDTDLSMVAGAFGLDPLAHTDPDRGFTLVHKTGTEQGIRCDTGLVVHDGRAVAYAVLANWQPDPVADGSLDVRDQVLARMRSIGDDIRARLVADAA